MNVKIKTLIKRIPAVLCLVTLISASIFTLADEPTITELTEAGSAQVAIGAEVPSNWKVTLPAKVSLVKQEDNTYKGTFDKIVSGDLSSDKKIEVKPSSTSITISDVNGEKTSKNATLIDSKKIFEYTDLSEEGHSCSLTCSGLTAGSWEGTLKYSINLIDIINTLYIKSSGDAYKYSLEEPLVDFIKKNATKLDKNVYILKGTSPLQEDGFTYQLAEFAEGNQIDYLISDEPFSLINNWTGVPERYGDAICCNQIYSFYGKEIIIYDNRCIIYDKSPNKIPIYYSPNSLAEWEIEESGMRWGTTSGQYKINFSQTVYIIGDGSSSYDKIRYCKTDISTSTFYNNKFPGLDSYMSDYFYKGTNEDWKDHLVLNF